jgi:putative tricarboxylic transport membrane protein
MVGSIALNRPQIDLSRVTPIARLTSELLVLVVPASSRHRSLHTFAEELKARTASMPIAGGGAGGVDHICAAMVGRAVNIDPAQLVYQPFSSGGEVLAAVASGKVAAAISGYGELKAGIMSGQVRALGISARRATYGVPSMREQGVNVELGNWRGVFAGNSLTPAQLGELREAVQKATLHPSWKETLTRNNWQASWLAGEELQRSIDFDLTSARVLVHMLKLKTA